MPRLKKRLNKKRRDLVDKFAWIERYWQGGNYFAGDSFSLVDAVYGPVFRYFDVFDAIADFNIFADTFNVRIWRQTLESRPSIQDAVVENYPQLLLNFLKQRNSYLSTLIQP